MVAGEDLHGAADRLAERGSPTRRSRSSSSRRPTRARPWPRGPWDTVRRGRRTGGRGRRGRVPFAPRSCRSPPETWRDGGLLVGLHGVVIALHQGPVLFGRGGFTDWRAWLPFPSWAGPWPRADAGGWAKPSPTPAPIPSVSEHARGDRDSLDLDREHGLDDPFRKEACRGRDRPGRDVAGREIQGRPGEWRPPWQREWPPWPARDRRPRRGSPSREPAPGA